MKSNSCDATADSGNTARGNAILVTRLWLLDRLWVENRIDATKNAHGAALIATGRTSRNIPPLPDTVVIASLTTTPAEVIRSGIRIAHRNPMIDCLYFTVTSRRLSM